MKATTILERQHRNLQLLCGAVQRGSVKIRESLLPQLAGDLEAHLAVEEQVFYPAACHALGEDVWMRSLRARHAQARRSMDQALAAAYEGEEFEHAIEELRNIIELHAEEQEGLLFPRLERELDESKMRELARSMLSTYSTKVEDECERNSAMGGRVTVADDSTGRASQARDLLVPRA